ncbi:MAG TPA: hypothetical protein VIH18_04435 [Candidatus Binatia bacterium]|jgi:hypothetical protein
MRHLATSWHIALKVLVIFLASTISGCGGARDETVAGVIVPVPDAMERISGQGIELSMPGFGGGQAAFQGSMAPDKIIEFYRKEMAARGWQPGASLLSRGGMLTYSKDGNNVLLAVGTRDGKSTLSVTVSSSAK